MVGEETEAAYNRVLVADLGVGRTTADALALSDAAALSAEGVDVRLGVRVRRVDRARQQVILTDGTSAHYERLVFATGSRPVIPNLTGINPDPTSPVLPAGVTALRDLRDAGVLRQAVDGGKRVVVLGGGVLGLETALAAAEEGATVTVVHNGPHPAGPQHRPRRRRRPRGKPAPVRRPDGRQRPLHGRGAQRARRRLLGTAAR